MRRTVEIAPRGPRPSISLRPAPPCEPPFDDELEPAVWATAHQLALDWSRPAAVEPVAQPLHRSVVAGASAEARMAVDRFIRLCVEVLNGYRPPAQLRRFARPADAAEVVAAARAGVQRAAQLRKAVRARPPKRLSPTAVINRRLCEPRPGAVEAAVALVTGERTWALALRLERDHDIWAATTLRLV